MPTLVTAPVASFKLLLAAAIQLSAMTTLFQFWLAPAGPLNGAVCAPLSGELRSMVIIAALARGTPAQTAATPNARLRWRSAAPAG